MVEDIKTTKKTYYDNYILLLLANSMCVPTENKCIFHARLFCLLNLFFLVLRGQRGQECPLEGPVYWKGLWKLLRTKISILSAGLGGSGNTLQWFPIVLNYWMSPNALHLWFYETLGGRWGSWWDVTKGEIRPIELKPCSHALAAAMRCSEGVWPHGFQELSTTLGCRALLEVPPYDQRQYGDLRGLKCRAECPQTWSGLCPSPTFSFIKRKTIFIRNN